MIKNSHDNFPSIIFPFVVFWVYMSYAVLEAVEMATWKERQELFSD